MGRESSPALHGPTPPTPPPQPNPDDRPPSPGVLFPLLLGWGNSTGSDGTEAGRLAGPRLPSEATNRLGEVSGAHPKLHLPR